MNNNYHSLHLVMKNLRKIPGLKLLLEQLL